MAKLFKKPQGIAFACLLGWILPFLVFPYFHFHPGDIHGHNGELQPHEHKAHLHSHELETLAHAFNLHPADSEQDEARHHSHSSAGHDSDSFEIDLSKAIIQTDSLVKLKTDTGDLSVFPYFTPVSSHLLNLDIGHFKEYSFVQNPQERAPPKVLI